MATKENPIIQFAEAVQESQNLSASQKDLLIREFMRNQEHLTKCKNESDTQIAKQQWCSLMGIFFTLAVVLWGICFVMDSSQEKLCSFIGLGTLFIMAVGFSIASFLGFIKKW